MDLEWINNHQADIKQLVFRNAITAFGHPFDLCKTLMQLGYEPFQPVEATSLILRTKYLGLPNVFIYLKYIKSVDGLSGCYRGLLPRLIESNLQFYVYNKLNVLLPKAADENTEKEKEPSNSGSGKTIIRGNVPNYLTRFIPEDVLHLLKSLARNVTLQAFTTTVTYPFRLLTVRAMAQFVGREAKYDSLLNGIRDIYENEGILGFFNGLAPRLVHDTISVVVVGTCMFIFTKYVSDLSNQVTSYASGVLANSVAYPYVLVSTVMSVNNNGLALGRPPHSPIFLNSYDCWKSLRAQGQIARGSAMFQRSFVGVFSGMGKGWLPGHQYFGPVHPPGLGLRNSCT